MIASVHLADAGLGRALSFVRTPTPASRGLRYAELALAPALSARLLPAPPRRLALIAAWEDEASLEEFLGGHPLARALAGGWHVRLQPARIWGAWSAHDWLADGPVEMDPGEPAAALTLGRLRLTQAPRFLRASARAEGAALGDPALLGASGLARPPRLVATFSLWRTTAAMRAYAAGAGGAHAAAVSEHRARPFHHESAFVRFRPLSLHGEHADWPGLTELTLRTGV